MEADLDLFADPGDPTRGGFRATLLVPGPRVGTRVVDHFTGRWITEKDLVATAVAVPHS
jgi:hypothetical protein